MAPAHKALVSAPDDGDILHEITIEGHQVSYLSVIGSLMYAMLGTRPDLAYTVGVLSRYSSAPRASHWVMAKRALQYLKGTANMELHFDSSDVSMDMHFHGYSDVDWSSDPDTSCLTSGYVFISNHGAISWASKRQTLVALSLTESEYIGLSNAGQHLAWLHIFFTEIGHSQEIPTNLQCDNQAVIVLWCKANTFNVDITIFGMTWWPKEKP